MGACGGSSPEQTTPAAEASNHETVFPERAELLAMIKQRVDEGRATGLVLAVREADGTHTVVAYGNAGPGAAPLSETSVFEIGSITKVFTGILLADMAAKGEVAIEDAAQKHAPSGVTIPQVGTSPIRLVDLSTHMSGLPRLPANMTPVDETNPYADYTVAQLHEFLAKHTPSRAPGVKHEYSNLAVGLLGHLLAHVGGATWEELVAERILGPLKMGMSGVELSPGMKAQLAIGHDSDGKPVPNWDLPTFAAAGALRSNTQDMLRFLDANLELAATPLGRAMAVSHTPQAKAGNDMQIGLGWFTTHSKDGKEIVWHSGGTGGYRSIIAMDPKRNIGVVILENSTHGPDDMAMHLLDNSIPLTRAPKARDAIAVSRETLATYEGIYQIAPNFHLHVSLLGDNLYAQATNQPKLQILAETEVDFFIKEFDAQLTFEKNETGAVVRVVLHQNGADVPAKRLEGEEASKALETIVGKQRTAIDVPAKTLKKYVGVYELSPTFKLKVTLEDGGLLVEATGQEKLPIFAEATTEFFSKAVDAQITFVTGAKGKVTSLVLHQGGMDQTAKKVE